MSTNSLSRTCGDVIELIRNRLDLPPRRRHDLISGVSRFCKLLHRRPSDVSADPDQIRRELAELSRAASGLSPGSYRNLKSLVSRAMLEAGVVAIPRRHRAAPAPEWQRLLASIEPREQRYRLSRLARYCTERGIHPVEVDQEVIARYRRDLSDSLLHRPSQAVRTAIQAWNRARSTAAGRDLQELRNENRCQFALPPSAFLASFREDLDAYLAYLKGADLFGERGGRAASPETIIAQRGQILGLASALVVTGCDPTSIKSLSHLVAPEAAKGALIVFWRRLGERKTSYLYNLSYLLLYVGKYWAKLPADQLDELRALRRNLNPRTVGMAESNRRRLRQFEDPINVASLLRLPPKLMDEAIRCDRGRVREAVLAQSAVAIAILLAAPLRARTLVNLNRDEHIVRSRPSPRAVTHLVIPPQLVKNRTPLEFVLPPKVVKLVDLYWERFRPRLVTEPGPFLFPGRHGPKKSRVLSTQVSETIFNAAGLRMHLHLFRHFAGYLILRRNPGEFETVRLLLGHRSSETTSKFYCGMEQAAAFARYDEIISAYLAEEDEDGSD